MTDLTKQQRAELVMELGRLFEAYGIDEVVRAAATQKALQAGSINARALGINPRALRLNARELKLVGADQ